MVAVSPNVLADHPFYGYGNSYCSPLIVRRTRRATIRVLVILKWLSVTIVATGYAVLMLFMAYMLAATSWPPGCMRLYA